MRQIVIGLCIVVTLGIYATAQVLQQPTIVMTADTGLMTRGQQGRIVELTGNVTIDVAGAQITTTAAVYHEQVREIELAGGAGRVKLLGSDPVRFDLRQMVKSRVP